MELIPSITTTTATTYGGGGGGGGPAPFLLKTYEMVDDSSTDEIVSWSSNNTSFIVWNPPEFARVLLPTYFKHNNFSSFIRQLNTYGFHKIDAEKWEFANEDFVKDKKHLLKKIHRRKPIHSHSHPPPDPERVAFEEEIEKLTRERNELDTKVLSFRMQESAAKSQLDDITYRLSGMEQRQEKLLTFLQKAVQDPIFVEHLAHKIEGMDLSAYNKRRRLPRVDNILPAADHSFGEYQSSCRPEVATTFQLDLSNKLNLELSTAVPNSHAVSNSTHSSNEDWASPPRKSTGADMKDVEMGVNTLPFSTENVERSDAGSCLGGVAFKMDSSLSDRVGAKESAGSQSLPLLAAEESDGLICCQLNLSLASSPILTNQNPSSVRATPMDMDISGTIVVRSDASGSNRNESGVADENNLLGKDVVNLSMSQETTKSNRNPTPAAPPRVNDHFWEQFLTERPGSTDTEEASSCYRAPHDEQEDRGSSHGMSRTANNLGKLTL